MRALQIGNGKMGKYIFRILQACPDITSFTVCDIKYTQEVVENGVRFVSSISDEEISDYDCAFVATPAVSHGQVIERLIRCGMKRIYVEKPAVMTWEEYEHIQAIRGDCKIVTGYILRQSEALSVFKKKFLELIASGFHLEFCSVTYQKYHPAKAEVRAMDDMGVFDEIVHIWDLFFTYLGFDKGEHRLLDHRYLWDPQRSDRIDQAQLTYYIKMEQETALLRLNSSFRATEKKREFMFFFKNLANDGCFASVSFDNADQYDHFVLADQRGYVMQKVDYPSLNKLQKQMMEVIQYFKTGNPGNLCLFEEAKTVIKLLDEAEI